MTKELFEINELVRFLDKKIDRLYERLEDFTSTGRTEESKELNTEISMWRGKRLELTDLQAKLVDTHIKELSQ